MITLTKIVNPRSTHPIKKIPKGQLLSLYGELYIVTEFSKDRYLVKLSDGSMRALSNYDDTEAIKASMKIEWWEED